MENGKTIIFTSSYCLLPTVFKVTTEGGVINVETRDKTGIVLCVCVCSIYLLLITPRKIMDVK
jgi:hypothetical protein